MVWVGTTGLDTSRSPYPTRLNRNTYGNDALYEFAPESDVPEGTVGAWIEPSASSNGSRN